MYVYEIYICLPLTLTGYIWAINAILFYLSESYIRKQNMQSYSKILLWVFERKPDTCLTELFHLFRTLTSLFQCDAADILNNDNNNGWCLAVKLANVSKFNCDCNWSYVFFVVLLLLLLLCVCGGGGGGVLFFFLFLFFFFFRGKTFITMMQFDFSKNVSKVQDN